MTLPERPRLRPIEAFPMRRDGDKMIGLRDPSHVAEAVLMVPAAALPIVAALDGQHTILDIQEAETRRQGRLVFREGIERLGQILNEHLFLEGPPPEAARRADPE